MAHKAPPAKQGHRVGVGGRDPRSGLGSGIWGIELALTQHLCWARDISGETVGGQVRNEGGGDVIKVLNAMLRSKMLPSGSGEPRWAGIRASVC